MCTRCLFLSAIYNLSSLKWLNAPYIILLNVSKSALAVMTPWSVINGIDPEPYLSNHTVAFWSQILNTGVETRAFLLFEILPIKGIRRKRFWRKLWALLFTQMSDEALGRKLLLYFCSVFFSSFSLPFLWAVSGRLHLSPLVCASSWWFSLMKVVPIWSVWTQSIRVLYIVASWEFNLSTRLGLINLIICNSMLISKE